MYVIDFGTEYYDFIYKDIKPIYEINKYGQVRNKITGKHLKPEFNKGYYRYTLRCNDNSYKRMLAHRMVALTFISDMTDTDLQVNHIDGNKLNNDVSNLEWVTASYNTRHAYMKGLAKTRRGTRSNFNKHSDEFIDFIVDRIKLGYSNKEIRKDLRKYRNDYNTYAKLIYELRTRKKWKHKFED